MEADIQRTGRTSQEADMKAVTGDRIIVASTHVGESPRDGEILEVHGADGEPPFLVRWSDDGHESLVFPGPDTRIRHLEGETE
jgi:Domain of unknown function (DUF1918)